MNGGVQYFVIVSDHRSRAAAGLARRRTAEAGQLDETLRADLSWQPDSAIVEWEYGDLAAELVPISEPEAANLTQALRARWRETR